MQSIPRQSDIKENRDFLFIIYLFYIWNEDLFVRTMYV